MKLKKYLTLQLSKKKIEKWKIVQENSSLLRSRETQQALMTMLMKMTTLMRMNMQMKTSLLGLDPVFVTADVIRSSLFSVGLPLQ